MKRKPPKPLSKFRNIPTSVDGIRFDSKKEAARYCELKLLEKAKVIADLRLQVRIPLNVNGKKIGHYIADFVYLENGRQVVEDVKSTATKTPLYNLKKKILATYEPPIEIIEV